MERQSNFTKRDILVFLGCVTFLVANLGAVGAGGRRLAKEVLCLSNLKELGNCFWQYTSDYNGYFGEGGSSKYEKWFNWLRPYYSPGETIWGTGTPVKKVNLLLCPSASSKFWSDAGATQSGNGTYPTEQSPYIAWGVFGNRATIDWQTYGACGSYGQNSWATSFNPAMVKIYTEKYWKIIDVPNGDNIPLLADCAHVAGKPDTDNMRSLLPPEFDGHWYGGSLASPGDAYSIARFVLNRHTEGTNYLFMDLSARKVGLKENWTLKWNRTFNTSNKWTKAGGVEPNDWPTWMRDFKEY